MNRGKPTLDIPSVYGKLVTDPWSVFRKKQVRIFETELSNLERQSRRLFQKELTKKAKEGETAFFDKLLSVKMEREREFAKEQKLALESIKRTYAGKTKVEKAQMLEAGQKRQQAQALAIQRRRATLFNIELAKWRQSQKQAFNIQSVIWEEQQKQRYERTVKGWKREQRTRFAKEIMRLKLLAGTPKRGGRHFAPL